MTAEGARNGGRIEVCLGRRGAGGRELEVVVPPGVCHGTKLRIAGVCPGPSDLLIEIEVRDRRPELSLLGDVLGQCPECERAGWERASREAQARRGRTAVPLPRAGALIGLGLVAILMLVIWACFG